MNVFFVNINMYQHPDTIQLPSIQTGPQLVARLIFGASTKLLFFVNLGPKSCIYYETVWFTPTDNNKE